MADSAVEAVIREFGGEIPEELAQQILDFRKAGDDVVQATKPKQ